MARWLDLVRDQHEDHDEEEASSELPTQHPMLTIVPRESEPDAGEATADLDPAEIARRVEVIRQQIPPHGPIRTLGVRLDVPIPTPPGICSSCGEPRQAGQTYVCRACQAALWLALERMG